MKSLYLKIAGGVVLSALLVSCPTHDLNPIRGEGELLEERVQHSSRGQAVQRQQASFYTVHDLDADGKADVIIDTDGAVLFYNSDWLGKMDKAIPMSSHVAEAASRYLSARDSSAMRKADDDLFFEMYMQVYEATSQDTLDSNKQTQKQRSK